MQAHHPFISNTVIFTGTMSFFEEDGVDFTKPLLPPEGLPLRYERRCLLTEDRKNEILAKSRYVTLAVTDLDSWTHDAFDIGNASTVKDFYGRLKEKDMLSAKMCLLMEASKDRIFYNKDALTFYGWMGTAWSEYIGKNGNEDLLLLLCKGII